jgi:hypothetical protein
MAGGTIPQPAVETAEEPIIEAPSPVETTPSGSKVKRVLKVKKTPQAETTAEIVEEPVVEEPKEAEEVAEEPVSAPDTTIVIPKGHKKLRGQPYTAKNLKVDPSFIG